jgi:hypothetical protein
MTHTYSLVSLIGSRLQWLYPCSQTFRLIATIFDFQYTQTSDSLRYSLVVLTDPGNVGVAVGISLRSYIEAEINVTSYVLLVKGHLL